MDETLVLTSQDSITKAIIMAFLLGRSPLGATEEEITQAHDAVVALMEKNFPHVDELN